jgi:two-component system chemotaxis response regulator CheB
MKKLVQTVPNQAKPDLAGAPAQLPACKSVILLGASAGGIDALLQIIRHFSDNCPPTLIVQHTGDRYARGLIRLLNASSDAKVAEALDGDFLSQGHIYMSPGAHAHLCLAPDPPFRIKLSQSSLHMGHRPSVDVLFDSAVPFAHCVTAAILTGMGRDGARGLTALRQAGARTFGQDQETSVVYGMPRAARAMGGVNHELPIAAIGPALLNAAMQGRSI